MSDSVEMIPYNTDAPLYHMPIATVGLIILNTVFFFAVPRSMVEFDHPIVDAIVEAIEDSGDEGDLAVAGEFSIGQRAASMAGLRSSGGEKMGLKLSLEYGQGVKPWQWFTSIFMHANFLHLLMNMIALWAFGLVVEGKVGLLPFLGMYMGIGVVQSAFEQLIMCFNGNGGSLGASAAIFGILGIAIVWAPRNEFEVFYQFGFRMGTTEIPILMFGFLQFALEAVSVALGQFGISAGVLHLMGFALGGGIGLVWLVRGWVDCEGWDLLTVIQGKEGRDLEHEQLEKEAVDLVASTHRPRSETAVRIKPTRTQIAAARTASERVVAVVPRSMFVPPPPSADDFVDLFVAPSAAPAESPHLRLYELIESGKHQQAIRLLIQMRTEGTMELPQPYLARLVRDLLTSQEFNNAIPLMAEHIRRFPENRVTLQINLAKVLLQKQRPLKALQVLKSVDAAVAGPDCAATLAGLTAHAERSLAAESQQSI